MLTFTAIRSGSGYNVNHLRYPDYQDEEAQVEGLWAGKLAAKLGLEGRVTESQFESMRTGLHPETGERLRERLHDSDRSRNLYDFTYSAPKSLSIQAELAPDSRLFEAHNVAVGKAFPVMESFAEARVRAEGANESRITGNLIAALYHHNTSRSFDPQIHTHCVLGNLTFDQVAGRHKALENGGIVSKLPYITEVYRNALAVEVRKLGYEIESHRDSYKNLGFELKGISKELRDKFSQRSRERDEAIAKFRKEKGRAPSNREVAVLVRETRPDKLQKISTARVREKQLSRLTLADWTELLTTKEEAIRRGPLQPTITVPGALQAARDVLFNRKSVVSRFELLAEGLRIGRGHIDNETLVAFLDYQIKEGAYVQHGHLLTSRETLAREQAMIDSVNGGVNRYGRLGSSWAMEGVSQNVKDAVNRALASRDRVIAIQGDAGSGKSEALWAIWNAARADGHTVFTLSANQNTAEALKAYGMRDAVPIQEFFGTHFDSKPVSGKGVVLVDEAGLVGSKEMGQLLNLTEDLGCRVVLSGEVKMTKPLDAGDALKILQRDSSLHTFFLNGIQRQSGEYRGAVQALRQSPLQGFMRLSKMNAINEVKIDDLYREAAKKYAKLAPNLGKKESVLAIAPSEDHAAFTHEIRGALKAAGKLGRGRQVSVLRPVHMTEPEKRELGHYRRGMYLVFHKETKNAKVSEKFRVKEVSDGKIIASKGLLNRASFTKKQAKCFEVYERVKIQVSKGDKLRLGKSGKSRAGRLFSFESKFQKGEVVTVKGFDALGRIALTDGRTLPRDYKQISHAYVFSPHGVRGKEAKHVVVLGDRMNREAFYTAASRGKDGISVYTSDKREFAKSIRVDMERMSAKELSQAKEREHAEKQGIEAVQRNVQSEGQAQKHA